MAVVSFAMGLVVVVVNKLLHTCVIGHWRVIERHTAGLWFIDVVKVTVLGMGYTVMVYQSLQQANMNVSHFCSLLL